jgi:DNA-binding response OmpR family regulator
MADENRAVETKPEILLLDADALAGVHLTRLRQQYHVTLERSVTAAAEYLRRASSHWHFLISDIRASGDDTLPLFRTAKSLAVPPTILVTTADVERVPEALIWGGDAVLLKPFSPNLLFSRLGRLKQERDARKQREAVSSLGNPHPHDALHTVGSLDVHCPHCNAAGAVTFDFLSYRRAWYACLACKKAWIAKLTPT